MRSLSRWCGWTGERQHVEFTVNPFLDVYTGHVNTLKHVLDRKEEAYHMLMQNIYTLARCVVVLSGKFSTADQMSSTPVPGAAGSEIAPIHVYELE